MHSEAPASFFGSPQGLFASDLDKIHLENPVGFEYNTHRQESKHKPAYKARNPEEVLFLNDFALFCLHGRGEKKLMDPKNKLGAMPVRPLLYTMAVPLMLSLLIQSLYNIVDSIFVARLSETALTAASLVYAIQFLMIAIGVGTAVGLNALLSRKLGQKKPEEACRAATTGLFLMPVNGLGQAAIPVVGYNYGSKQSDRVKQAWKVLLPTGIVFALCGTAVFLLFPRQLLGLFSASEEMLAFGVPALRIISVTFLFAVITMRGMVFPMPLWFPIGNQPTR